MPLPHLALFYFKPTVALLSPLQPHSSPPPSHSAPGETALKPVSPPQSTLRSTRPSKLRFAQPPSLGLIYFKSTAVPSARPPSPPSPALSATGSAEHSVNEPASDTDTASQPLPTATHPETAPGAEGEEQTGEETSTENGTATASQQAAATASGTAAGTEAASGTGEQTHPGTASGTQTAAAPQPGGKGTDSEAETRPQNTLPEKPHSATEGTGTVTGKENSATTEAAAGNQPGTAANTGPGTDTSPQTGTSLKPESGKGATDSETQKGTSTGTEEPSTSGETATEGSTDPSEAANSTTETAANTGKKPSTNPQSFTGTATKPASGLPLTPGAEAEQIDTESNTETAAESNSQSGAESAGNNKSTAGTATDSAANNFSGPGIAPGSQSETGTEPSGGHSFGSDDTPGSQAGAKTESAVDNSSVPGTTLESPTGTDTGIGTESASANSSGLSSNQGSNTNTEAESGVGNLSGSETTPESQRGTESESAIDNIPGSGSSPGSQTGAVSGTGSAVENTSRPGTTPGSQSGTGTGSTVEEPSESGTTSGSQSGTGTETAVDNSFRPGATTESQSGTEKESAVDNSLGSGATHGSQTGTGAESGVDKSSGTQPTTTPSFQSETGTESAVDNASGAGITNGSQAETETGTGTYQVSGSDSTSDSQTPTGTDSGTDKVSESGPPPGTPAESGTNVSGSGGIESESEKPESGSGKSDKLSEVNNTADSHSSSGIGKTSDLGSNSLVDNGTSESGNEPDIGKPPARTQSGTDSDAELGTGKMPSEALPGIHSHQNPIKIGITLSGAATGGCYEAGFMDFMIEALQCYSAKLGKEVDNDNPDSHHFPVCIDKMAGTSAGGITSLLACASFSLKEFTPLPHGYEPGDTIPYCNPLFNVWVKQMTMEQLFNFDDLEPEQRGDKVVVKSILNSEFFNRATNSAFEDHFWYKMPSWATNVELIMPNFSLRGIPYSIGHWNSVFGDDERYYMRNCEDYTSFVITTNSPDLIPPGMRARCDVLNLNERLCDMGWQRAISGAKATAGFPGGFPTASIQTKCDQYKDRDGSEWLNWNQNQPIGDPQYNEYAAVDGGIMNNDPFGILERLMYKGDMGVPKHEQDSSGTEEKTSYGAEEGEEGSEKHKTEEKSETNAIILVSPFPCEKNDNQATQEGMSLIQMFVTLLRILYRGLRYKEADGNEESIPKSIVTPFEGTPVTKDSDKKEVMSDKLKPDRNPFKPFEYNGRARARELCCEGMGSFSGILDERLRLHDYQLGRANCQQFLKHTFVMSPMRENDGKKSGAEVIRHEKLQGVAERRGKPIPIIPLYGSAAEHVPVPERLSLGYSDKNQVVTDGSITAARRINRITWVYLSNIWDVISSHLGNLEFVWKAIGYPLKLVLWYASKTMVRPILWEIFNDALSPYCSVKRKPLWQQLCLLYVRVVCLSIAGAVFIPLLVSVPFTTTIEAFVFLFPTKLFTGWIPVVRDILLM